jgi:hypothetical protein
MRERRFLLAATAGLAGLSLLLGACGDNTAAPAVAQLGSATSTTASSSSSGGSKHHDMLAYARCMRQNGVPTFPDPTGSGAISINSGEGIDPNSPQFQAAQAKCKSLVPAPSPAQQQQAEQNALKFSKCMRANGVPNFPDPTFNNSGGGAKLQIGSGSGIDPNSPQFQAAQAKCGKELHMPTPTGGPKPGNGSGGGSGMVIG